jgi:hypothetical protein
MSRLTLPMTLALLISLSPACGFSTTQAGYEDLVCDPTGCFHCSVGTCVEYRCDALNQCPMDRICSSDNRCLPEEQTLESSVSEETSFSRDGQSGTCRSHRDCPHGDICLTDGSCVKSPGRSEESEPDASAPEEVNVQESVDETRPNNESVEDSPTLPEHPLGQCVLNNDCGQDGRCLDGKCYFPCSPTDVCAPVQNCQDGFCAPTTEQEVECTFHAECGPSRLCIDGLCYDSCEETFECGAHMTCENGICVADTSPVIQCAGPDTCGDGQGCIDGKCLAVCEEHADCAAQGSCQFGYCHQLVTCQLNLDCQESEVCLDGQCE